MRADIMARPKSRKPAAPKRATRKRAAPKSYESAALPHYMHAASQNSRRAPTSHVPNPNAIVSPVEMSHLALMTGNFDEVADWWQTVLGLEPSLDADGMRFMTIGHEHHNVVIFEQPGLKRRSGPPLEQSGMHHIAWTYASFEDLAKTYRRLKAAGILPYRAINHGTSFAIDYFDPDFNACELQCNCFPDPLKKGLNAWLATGAFNRNPIGVLFDFEEAIERHERGEDVWDIVSPYALRVGEHDEAEARAAEKRGPVRQARKRRRISTARPRARCRKLRA
jgi:catechol 2,3-dioxygenase-like lactoylglutathione lyase family enzyme